MLDVRVNPQVFAVTKHATANPAPMPAIRTTHARTPAADAARYRLAMNRDRRSFRWISSAVSRTPTEK
jgi:hypothetical protein